LGKLDSDFDMTKQICGAGQGRIFSRYDDIVFGRDRVASIWAAADAAGAFEEAKETPRSQSHQPLVATASSPVWAYDIL
jgi:hypothetical protein